MWWVRPATMTRRTERLSRLWLTTMPSDFATFLRLSRLSPERLYDFPARVYDFDKAADLALRGRRLFRPIGQAVPLPADRRRVPPGRRGRCRGSGLIGAAFFAFYIYIVHFLLSFRTVESIKKKLELFLETLLTFKLKLDILQSSS